MTMATTIDQQRKRRDASELAALSESYRAAGQSIVLCHGCFDVVHPGHLRYLQFARQQGDVLVVSLTGDDAIEKADGTRPYVPQELRAEALAALELVAHVVIIDDATAEPVIISLRPHIYIKGKEYEGSRHPGFVAEKALVESLGGQVMFSSGEVVFSSSALIERMEQAATEDWPASARLSACCERWGITRDGLTELIDYRFTGRRVLVVGDAIDDRYTFCDASSVASEAPMMSLRPLREHSYLGGAAVIAAHLKRMGAEPHLVTAIGNDAASARLIDQLDAKGIAHTAIRVRGALPMKQRYLVESQKLMKVDHAQEQPVDAEGERAILASLESQRTTLDAAIFADFGCGLISTSLLEKAAPMLRPHVRTLAAGVSGPRRSLMSMANIDLLTLNERELRGIMGDYECGLPALAASLMSGLHLANLVLTLGERGSILFRPREDDPARWFESRLRNDYLPAMSGRAVDPLGAGDAYLAAATLALCSGASLPHAGYVGSMAAALAVEQIGNQAVDLQQLRTRLLALPA